MGFCILQLVFNTWSTMADQPVCTARCGCLRIATDRLDLVQFTRRPWYMEYCCLRCYEAHVAQQAPSHGRLCESRCARCGERHDGISVQDHRCGDLTPWERTVFGQLALSDRHRIRFYWLGTCDSIVSTSNWPSLGCRYQTHPVVAAEGSGIRRGRMTKLCVCES